MSRYEPFDLKPQWQLLVEFMQAQPDGYIADKGGLAHVVGCKPDGVASVVHVANRQMAPTGFRIKHERRKGYRVATPADCLDETLGRRPRIIVNAVRRAKAAGVAAFRNEHATPEERSIADEAVLVHAEHERLVVRQRRELRGKLPETPRVRQSSEA